MRDKLLIKPVLCAKCGQPGGIKRAPPLIKIGKGMYAHRGKCPPKPVVIRRTQ